MHRGSSWWSVTTRASPSSPNRLSADDTIDNMPTCAVFTARFDITDWDRLDWGSGQDAEFDYPRKPT